MITVINNCSFDIVHQSENFVRNSVAKVMTLPLKNLVFMGDKYFIVKLFKLLGVK